MSIALTNSWSTKRKRQATGLKKRALLCLACLPLASHFTLGAGPEYDLRYRFEPGEVTYTQLDIETTSREIPDSTHSSTQRTVKQSMKFEVRVASNDQETGATLLFILRAARIELANGSGRPDVRDSHARRKSQNDRFLRDLVGSTAAIVVRPDGSIASAEGLDMIGRVMTAHLTSNEIEQQLAAALTQTLSDQMLSRAREGGFRFLPDHPVTRGETWRSSADQHLPMIGSAQLEWRHRLARVQRSRGADIATITTELDVTLAPNPGGSALGGLMTIVTQGATGRGETRFDVTRGRALRSELEIELPIEVSIPDLDSLEMRTIRQVIRTSMTHKIIEEREVPSLPD